MHFPSCIFVVFVTNGAIPCSSVRNVQDSRAQNGVVIPYFLLRGTMKSDSSYHPARAEITQQCYSMRIQHTPQCNSGAPPQHTALCYSETLQHGSNVIARYHKMRRNITAQYNSDR